MGFRPDQQQVLFYRGSQKTINWLLRYKSTNFLQWVLKRRVILVRSKASLLQQPASHSTGNLTPACIWVFWELLGWGGRDRSMAMLSSTTTRRYQPQQAQSTLIWKRSQLAPNMAVRTGIQTHLMNVTVSLLATAPENWSVQPSPSLVKFLSPSEAERAPGCPFLDLLTLVLWGITHTFHTSWNTLTEQIQPRFAEVQETAQQAWDIPRHLLTPFPSRYCGSGTWGPQPSISDVDTTSHCLVTLALTLARAENLFAHLTPAEPCTDALSWYYTILLREQAACLLFNSGESFPFVPILLSKEGKERKEMP